jgi:hypothetical protein
MKATLTSKYGESKLTVQVTGYQKPEGHRLDILNRWFSYLTWLDILISYKDPNFSAERGYNQSVSLNEIKSVSEGIGNLLSKGEGEYKFVTEWPVFGIEIALQKTGSAVAKGFIGEHQHYDDNSYLNYYFDTDQSCLRLFNEEICEIAERIGEEKKALINCK